MTPKHGFPWTQPGASFDFNEGPDRFNERAAQVEGPGQAVESHIRLNPRRCRGVADGAYQLSKGPDGGWIARVTTWSSLPFSVAEPTYIVSGISTAWGETPHEAVGTALMSL